MSGFSFHAYLLDAIGWPIAGGQVITGQIVVAALIGLAWVFMSFWFEPMFSLGSAAWLILTVACVLLAGIVGFRSSIRPYLAKVPPVTGIISSVIIGIVLGSIIGGVVVLHIWVGDDDISPEAQVRKRLWESGIGWHYSEYLDRAQRGELDIVRQFWNGGMLVDSSNQSGETILHKAARNGHLDILKEAIERGANINTEMVGGGTPLYEAIYPGHEHIVRELIERDAELNHRTAISNERGGCTALLIAAVRGHVGVVRLLVDAGARIDIQNASGITPLMAAAFNNYPEIVSFQLEKGADPTLLDRQGANSMDYVLAERGSSITEKVLVDAGLRPTEPRKTRGGTSGSNGCILVLGDVASEKALRQRVEMPRQARLDAPGILHHSGGVVWLGSNLENLL